MGEPAPRFAAWKWLICGLLLLATMLNYMDRQTLSQMSTEICEDLVINKYYYGWLEGGFGIAFALGAVCTGLLVDRLSIRWLYPAVVVGWSAVGFATAFVNSYEELMVCRLLLGFLEAGQWPCALTTIQRTLTRKDRTLGNGILQSGAALGAIFTPIVVLAMVTPEPGGWRGPFQVIGAVGVLWIIPWFLLIGRNDLKIGSSADPDIAAESATAAAKAERQGSEPPGSWAERLSSWLRHGGVDLTRRFLVLVVMVVAINVCWHFFRAWLPMFLREYHHYDRDFVQYFSIAYYVATDLGSIAVGFLTRSLITRGWSVFMARLVPFLGCALLTALSVIAAQLPAGWALLGMFLVIGFGALGLFPNYYAFSQELTARHQGKLTGALGCINWIAMAIMQPVVGARIDATKSYADGIMFVGLAPLAGFLAAFMFWNWPKQKLDTQAKDTPP
jgi:ACS family hexuronate transporter-like MFS transporter